MQFYWHSESAAFILLVLYVWNYRPTDIEADNAHKFTYGTRVVACRKHPCISVQRKNEMLVTVGGTVNYIDNISTQETSHGTHPLQQIQEKKRKNLGSSSTYKNSELLKAFPFFKGSIFLYVKG